MRNVLIIIPTLNEYKNIGIIYKKIIKLHNYANILFVDDNSLDGSKEEIIELKKKNKRVHYIFRNKKLGIGSAHKVAIKWAKKKKYQYVFTMDCDGSHDPKYIKPMFKFIKKNNIIITNRFLFKDSLIGWGYKRIFITKMRYYLIFLLLGSKLDGSGAFRLYDLNTVNLKDLMMSKDNNYNFFWESAFLLERKYKIYQLPIKLRNRSLGSSKMKFKDLLSGLFYLLKIFINYKLRKI